jgi:hypothetical protein
MYNSMDLNLRNSTVLLDEINNYYKYNYTPPNINKLGKWWSGAYVFGHEIYETCKKATYNRDCYELNPDIFKNTKLQNKIVIIQKHERGNSNEFTMWIKDSIRGIEECVFVSNIRNYNELESNHFYSHKSVVDCLTHIDYYIGNIQNNNICNDGKRETHTMIEFERDDF